MKTIIATHRVQLTPDFGFRETEEICDYLAALGVSHLYTSPYLAAVKGSTHGYDVLDPCRVNEELGGTAARTRLCARLASLGLGHVIDVVPNHMAIRGGDNDWWWDVLENGPSSRYSNFFDVEWRAPAAERVLLPILGDQYGVELESGAIRLGRNGSRFHVAYHEYTAPVAPRSLGRLLRPLAEEIASAELGFLADALTELPSPNAVDTESRRRRHRDKHVLLEMLARLLKVPEVGEAVDRFLEQVNASADALHDVLEHQHYRLSYWRMGSFELEYRRFFDIDSLVGLRVEDEEVLEATHSLIFSWLEDGSVDGLRIDHVDGLFDPSEYLSRVRQRSSDAWIVVEKILEPGERLPDWPVAGTTGYDFLENVSGVLVDPDGEAGLTATYHELLGHEEDFTRAARDCKRHVLTNALRSDVRRLVARLHGICQKHRRYRDYPEADLEAAVVELCASFGVYRTYLTKGGEPTERDRAIIQDTFARLRTDAPELDERLVQFIERLLLMEWKGEEEVHFVLRLQQLTGPAMAKGLEDTAFYRYQRFVALNEVGGNPARFALDVDGFHQAMRERQEHLPLTMNATSTHDTKRSEDVRARLFVLSEIPELWQRTVTRWMDRLRTGDRAELLDGRTLYGILQNLVGAWPLTRERLFAYAVKAAREAKLLTSWHAPNEAYESALLDVLGRAHEDVELRLEVDAFVESIADAGLRNSLCQKLLALMCPGVPDLYQGSDLWDFSLVDPDNRRAVDYGARAALLSELDSLDAETLWARRKDGSVKLKLIRECLALRRRHPAAFLDRGGYEALAAENDPRGRCLAFARGGRAVAVLARFWQRHGDRLDDATLELPEGTWKNLLLGNEPFTGGVAVQQLLGPLPVAVLERISD